jgi:hypothetical protein
LCSSTGMQKSYDAHDSRPPRLTVSAGAVANK